MYTEPPPLHLGILKLLSKHRSLITDQGIGLGEIRKEIFQMSLITSGANHRDTARSLARPPAAVIITIYVYYRACFRQVSKSLLLRPSAGSER